MSQAYTILLAPNPSIMTGPGTNTIVLGGGSTGAIVIDPADENPEHLAAIIQAGEERGGIRRILVTHEHPDHIGGAAILQERLGVPICSYGTQGSPFTSADEDVSDGATFPVGDDILRAIYTPGHSEDHLCYLLERQRILFAGDMISGITTNVVADMYDYLNSLKRLQSIDVDLIVPAHGPVISNPQAKIAEYIAHRIRREEQVLEALHTLPPGSAIPVLVEHIYVDVDPGLHPVAAWSVEAHLLKLEREGRVRSDEQGRWWLV